MAMKSLLERALERQREAEQQAAEWRAVVVKLKELEGDSQQRKATRLIDSLDALAAATPPVVPVQTKKRANTPVGQTRQFVAAHANFEAAHPQAEIRRLHALLQKKGSPVTFTAVNSAFYVLKRQDEAARGVVKPNKYGAVRAFVAKHADLTAARPHHEVKRLTALIQTEVPGTGFGAISAAFYSQRKLARATKPTRAASTRQKTAQARDTRAGKQRWREQKRTGTRPTDALTTLFRQQDGTPVTLERAAEYLLAHGHNWKTHTRRVTGLTLKQMTDRRELKQVGDGWIATQKLLNMNGSLPLAE